MSISRIQEDGVTLLVPAERIDQDGARRLETALAAEPPDAPLIVDLSGVSYINSLGLRVFVAAQKRRKGQGPRAGLVLCGLTASVAEVFRVSGMSRVLTVHATRSEALAALVPPSVSTQATSGAGGEAVSPPPPPPPPPPRPAAMAPGGATARPDGPADGPWRVMFWGTRGSLPVAADAATIRAKIRAVLEIARTAGTEALADIDRFMDQRLPFHLRGGYGGNSPCVQVSAPGAGEADIVLDLGSGLRALGQHDMARLRDTGPRTYNIFVSHPHWDHIMGMPFFGPAYVPGNRLRIHGCHPELEYAIRRQQELPSFPVDFSIFNAEITFVTLEPGRPYAIPETRVTVTPFAQVHPGGSFGYRMERGGKVLVYATDSEHKLNDQPNLEAAVQAFAGADLVIFDAMYALADALTMKEDWGHSSNVMGVDLCHMAGARRLALFHHEPIHDDEALDRILAETRRFEDINRGDAPPLDVLMAHDGQVVIL